MKTAILASLLLLTATVPATAQVSIGLTISAYPNFMVVPGYPVYYAPDVGANFFFYDGAYWVYQNDSWYSSTWYNGPWDLIDPLYVPIFVLRVPVRYYERPPRYFLGWQADRAPRWNDHWGRDWAQRRGDWDRPQRAAYVAPAPLPDYQRRYSGRDYPRGEQQRALQQQNYHYHSQSIVSRVNPGRQPDDRRSEVSRSGNLDRPNYSGSGSRREQSRNSDRPNYYGSESRREQPRPSPQPEQQRAPVMREYDRGGAGAQTRRSPEPAYYPQQRQRGEQQPRNTRNQDRGRDEGQDHRGDQGR